MYGTWIFGSAGPLRFRKDNKNMLGTAGFSINSLPKFKGAQVLTSLEMLY